MGQGGAFAYVYFFAGISLLVASAIYFKNGRLVDSVLWLSLSAVFLAFGYLELTGKGKTKGGSAK